MFDFDDLITDLTFYRSPKLSEDQTLLGHVSFTLGGLVELNGVEVHMDDDSDIWLELSSDDVVSYFGRSAVEFPPEAGETVIPIIVRELATRPAAGEFRFTLSETDPATS